MSEMSNEAIQAQFRTNGLRIGNYVRAQTTDAPTTGSQAIFIDSSGQLGSGTIPFTIVTSAATTASAILDISGSATGTANDLMHLTLVSSANATATVAGYYRINVTDAAGVVTTGSYYAPFYTLG